MLVLCGVAAVSSGVTGAGDVIGHRLDWLLDPDYAADDTTDLVLEHPHVWSDGSLDCDLESGMFVWGWCWCFCLFFRPLRLISVV